MSDIKISLSGSETVTITGHTIDKLIRAGDGDAALLYLYILKTKGKSTSSEAAIALDKSKGWVASAMAMLSRLGLIELDNKADANSQTTTATSDTAAGEPYKEPRKFTEDEVKGEIIRGSEFSIVVDETQRRLGKILSPDEMLRLFGIYENMRLPAEVILQLITHCINESRVTGDGRAPSIRYIEKAAITWEREGIFSLEKAEEYLKALEALKSKRGEMRLALQIKNRELSATEKSYVDDWITMGFDPEAVAIAYDKTVVKTGKLEWKYIDAIMGSWHSKGLHTAKQVLEMDGNRRGSSASSNAKPGGQKHGEPNRGEIERLKRILDKTKEE